ncbi:MAG: A24 family peptidase [Phycisphaerales bacterium]
MAVFQWGVVIGASLVAAGGDLRQRRIPNALTVPLLVVGLVWSAWVGGLSGLAEAAGACILLAAPYVLLFVFAGGGAGDAKLMGAIGAWLGLTQGVIVLLCVATAGFVLAAAKAIAKKQSRSVLTTVIVFFYSFMLFITGRKTMRPVSYRTDSEQAGAGALDLPYGVAISAGVCIAGAIVWLLGVEWLW